MPGEKRPKVEVEAIANQICIMLIKGVTRKAEILRYISKMDALPEKELAKRNWIVVGEKCDRTIDDYIRKAKDIFLQMAEQDRKDVKSLYLAQLEDMYQEARQKGHLQTANNIMKNKMYLQGMGGFNVAGTFSVKTFDIALNEEETTEYKSRLKDMYGDGFLEK